MRVIYLAHPLGAPTSEGVNANIQRAKRWVRWVHDHFKNVAVVADWLITCEVLADFNPEHRTHGMTMNSAIIKRCDEFWMAGGQISSGMASECALTFKTRLKVFDLTWLGEEPPAVVPDGVLSLCA